MKTLTTTDSKFAAAILSLISRSYLMDIRSNGAGYDIQIGYPDLGQKNVDRATSDFNNGKLWVCLPHWCNKHYYIRKKSKKLGKENKTNTENNASRPSGYEPDIKL